MIKVYIATKTCHIHFRKVDNVEIVDNLLSVFIDGRCNIYNLDDILTYEIRKENYDESYC